MFTQGKTAKAMMWAGIPLLALPLVAESGMSGERAQRDHGQSKFSGTRNSLSQGNGNIVQGEISQKEGDRITLQTTNGERISFKMDSQTTSQFCPQQGITSQTPVSEQRTTMRSDSSTSGSGQQQSGQSSSGMQQEQEKAGLLFGECQFEQGEFIKAKLDERGNATFVRSWGRDGERQFRAGRMGEEYFVLPAGQLGGLDLSDKVSGYSVKTSEGEKIGQVYRVLTNSRGDISYALIRKDDEQLISVPWEAMEGSGSQTFTLNVSQKQIENLPVLEDDESPVQHVQRNWDLTEQEEYAQLGSNQQDDYFRDRYGVRQSRFDSEQEYPQRGSRPGVRGDRYDPRRDYPAKGYPQRGARPGEAGEPGDVSIFGSPSTLPPGQHAPQYSGADQQRFRGDAFRNRGEQARYREDRQQSFDRDRRSRYSDKFQSRRGQDRYDRRDRSRQSDRNRPEWYSHEFETPLNEGRFMDPLMAPRYSDVNGERYETHPRRRYGMDRRKEGEVYEEYQSRRERGGGRYDYRPDPYQP